MGKQVKQYDVEGMHCSACVVSVEKAVGELPEVNQASVNLATNSLQTEGDVEDEEVLKAVEKAGYKASVKIKESLLEDNKKLEDTRKDNLKQLRGRVIWSFVYLIPLIYISMGTMFGLPVPEFIHPEINPLHFALSQFVLTTPILFINYEIFVSGVRALFNRRPNMNSLVAIGTGSAYLYGLYATYAIGFLARPDMAHHLYYESAGMILTLITLGKYFEDRATGHTSDAISKLISLAPETALLIGEDGLHSEVEVKDLKVGDKLLVKPGARIPIDGVIIKGTTSVDESMITGESIPVTKTFNELLTGATINKQGTVEMRVTAIGEDTTLSKIVTLVQEAQGTKAPISKLADKISGVFVPIVMVIAILSGIAWYLLFGQTLEFALTVFITTLVIACPCALGLATPTAIMVGTGKGAENGILYKSGETIERASDTEVVVLDKTGTITHGTPKLTDFEVYNYHIEGMEELPKEDEILLYEEFKKEVLRDVASIERLSEHPLSTAIVNGYKELYKDSKTMSANSFKAETGLGVTGRVDGRRYYIGNLAYMKENKVDVFLGDYNKMSEEGKTVMFIARGSKYVGMLAVADTIREDAIETVQLLQDSGIKVKMLTGDNKRTARAIAKQVGISQEDVISEVLPSDKSSHIKQIQSENKVVAMVGDGINDAPALAQADVGIAMGAGTDVAIESADVVLMHDNLLDVYKTLKLSHETMKNIKQNLFFAFIYNVIGIPIAMGVLYPLNGMLLSPMIAGLAMSLSSVSVVLNALRLNRVKLDK